MLFNLGVLEVGQSIPFWQNYFIRGSTAEFQVNTKGFFNPGIPERCQSISFSQNYLIQVSIEVYVINLVLPDNNSSNTIFGLQRSVFI